MENPTTRAKYDDMLRDWNKQQLELGTDKTNNAVRTIHDVNDALESADKDLSDAEEVILTAKFTDPKVPSFEKESGKSLASALEPKI